MNLPIVLCLVRVVGPSSNDHNEDDQLQKEILLCIGQQIMLTKNLWIQAGLVNRALGQITAIIYNINSKPPELPKYVVINFKNYIGPPWDTQNPMNVPISPITWGNRTQLPLTMSWAITIHKSQGLTLKIATIDIGTRER